jgi:hypothetical protein
MTHFRFRYKRVGYIRWRRRSTFRPAVLVVPALATAELGAPSKAAWRRTAKVVVASEAPTLPNTVILHIGEFIVSEEGDPQLLGHPDIRY